MKIYFYKSNEKERKYEAFTNEGCIHTDGHLYVFPETRKIKNLFIEKFDGKDIRIQDKEDRFIVTFRDESDEAYFLLWTVNGLDI